MELEFYSHRVTALIRSEIEGLQKASSLSGSLFQWGNRGPVRLTDLPKVKQVMAEPAALEARPPNVSPVLRVLYQ